jgi:hypothetical protein
MASNAGGVHVASAGSGSESPVSDAQPTSTDSEEAALREWARIVGWCEVSCDGLFARTVRVVANDNATLLRLLLYCRNIALGCSMP